MKRKAGLFTGLSVLLLISAGFLAACQPKMSREGRVYPYESSRFFPNGASARPLIADTVSREAAVTGGPTEFPYEVTPELLKRGQQRFDIYCSVCHGLDGNGDGMAVQRGFPAPPSYNIKRLRDAPVTHFFDVMTQGYGRMLSYADRVTPDDRWAIAAYIRALQLSQNAPVSDLTPAERRKLEGSSP